MSTTTQRALIAISGEDAVSFLQGLVTQDVTKLANEKIQFAALLSPQGKILHDMFLIADGDRILIDTPEIYKDTLMKRLNLYKLRAKVTIEALPAQVGYSYERGLNDPRHAALPKRVYGEAGDVSASEYRAASLALGIPDSATDFAPDSVTPLDAGYDLLNGISFTKGCYVGQEVTARMHYKNIARKGFYLVEGGAKLALLKFDDAPADAQLPEWMAPKLAQHKTNLEQKS